MPASSSDQLVQKRRRVTIACDTCRAMKAKCDGKHPSCGRCRGYEYECHYSSNSRSKYRRQQRNGQDAAQKENEQPREAPLCAAIDEYHQTVQKMIHILPESERANAKNTLASIKARVDDEFSQLRRISEDESNPTPVLDTPRLPSIQPQVQLQRYLGEVSDVSFFNLVKHFFQGSNFPDPVDESMDSYEQEDPMPQNAYRNGELSLELPSPAVAEEYLDVYWSTIHIAYPFIPRSSFLRAYRRLRDSAGIEDIDRSWLALLYVVFAIGNYYTSFPSKRLPTNAEHEKYYQLALWLSSSEPTEASSNRVTFLLAECFYLLAVCRTNRCWTELGLAVRIAQSIGLHVEREDPSNSSGASMLKAEMRRRLWYSIYVLDRLLALQLGRPPAIHDEDCHITLPSRNDDSNLDWEGESFPPDWDADGQGVGDYFRFMIDFSKIVGRVLRDFYSPRRERLVKDELLIAKDLNKQLWEWKLGLPRTLRFDIGHTFEKCLIFKRQRNMLAVKFHHLRALINRPFLFLPILRRLGPSSMTLLSETDTILLHQYEQICILEAQETAHLLHNVVDEKDLVHDFPWWQMISCLTCASSILLVASALTGDVIYGSEELNATGNSQLSEDAETCLKVFEALSANSEGARIARDMLKRLQERGISQRSQHRQSIQAPSSRPAAALSQRSQEQRTTTAIPPYIGLLDDSFDSSPAALGADNSAALSGYQLWPPEIWDSMNWSAQCLDAFP